MTTVGFGQQPNNSKTAKNVGAVFSVILSFWDVLGSQSSHILFNLNVDIITSLGYYGLKCVDGGADARNIRNSWHKDKL